MRILVVEETEKCFVVVEAAAAAVDFAAPPGWLEVLVVGETAAAVAAAFADVVAIEAGAA